MSYFKFKQLFLWELRNTPRRALLWVVVGILFASFCWGAFNAAELNRGQSRSVQAALDADADWQRSIMKDASRYSKPSNDIIEYWQDPTDIDAFSRNFLRESAVKPTLPLSALSVGQSDLLPYIFAMKLETAFGVDTSYDFEHPRGLALGVFDLGFAVVFFLPIGVILLVAMTGAFERDHGILRLAASQAVSPRMLLGSKMLALAAWLVPLLLAALVLALLVAGAPLGRDPLGLLSALVIITTYAMFWFSLAWLVLSYQQGAAASASVLIAIWALFAIVVPKAATFATALLVPRDSYVLHVNLVRKVETDVMQGGKYWEGAFQYWLDSRPEPRAHMIDTIKSNNSLHLMFAAIERERRLRPSVERMAQERADAAKWTILVELLSPPAALQDALSTLAGNDPRRHDRFLHSVQEYQIGLRRFLYPKMESQLLNPRFSNCVGCPGHITFTEYDKVPEYAFPELSSLSRSAPALLWASFFILISGVMGAAAYRRGRVWRSGELQ